jgi:hypothetical protein
MRLKAYFEEKAGKDIYDLVEKDSYTLEELNKNAEKIK